MSRSGSPSSTTTSGAIPGASRPVPAAAPKSSSEASPTRPWPRCPGAVGRADEHRGDLTARQVRSQTEVGAAGAEGAPCSCPYRQDPGEDLVDLGGEDAFPVSSIPVSECRPGLLSADRAGGQPLTPVDPEGARSERKDGATTSRAPRTTRRPGCLSSAVRVRHALVHPCVVWGEAVHIVPLRDL